MVPAPETKLLSTAQAVAWRRELAAAGRRLVMTNGCFDLIHRGHVAYLFGARRLGDALLVAVNSDRSVGAIKPGRPIMDEIDRAYVLGGLAAVDGIVIFDTKDVTGLLQDIRPDLYVKGATYTEETINQDERRVLNRLGIPIAFTEAVDGLSSTELIARIRALPG